MVIEEEVYQKLIESKIGPLPQDAKVEFVQRIAGRLHGYWDAFEPDDRQFSEAVRAVLDNNRNQQELMTTNDLIWAKADRACEAYEETDRAKPLKDASPQGIIAD